MLARVVVYLGLVLIAALLLLERPTPMAIAPPAAELPGLAAPRG